MNGICLNAPSFILPFFFFFTYQSHNFKLTSKLSAALYLKYEGFLQAHTFSSFRVRCLCAPPNLPVLFTFLTHPPGLFPLRLPSALYMSRQIYLSIMTPASSVCREFQMNASASRRELLAAYHARDQIKAPALCGASLSRQLIIKSSHHTPHLFPGP